MNENVVNVNEEVKALSPPAYNGINNAWPSRAEMARKETPS